MTYAAGKVRQQSYFKMASRLSIADVLQQLDDDNLGFSDDGSDFGGEGLAGYFPEAAGSLLLDVEEGSELLQASDDKLDFDYSGDGDAGLETNMFGCIG